MHWYFYAVKTSKWQYIDVFMRQQRVSGKKVKFGGFIEILDDKMFFL